MTIRKVSARAIETSTGQYELREFTNNYFLVWSIRSRAPIGVYPTEEEAVEQLNSIRMGDPLPDQGQYRTWEEILAAAEALTEQWQAFKMLDLPLSERLLLAIDSSWDASEIKILATLAVAAARLEERDADSKTS